MNKKIYRINGVSYSQFSIILPITMSSKTFYDYAMYITYGAIVAAWCWFSFVTFMNIKHLYDNSFTAIMVSFVFPPALLVLTFAGISIVFIRVDTRVSALSKFGTNDSWDVAETFEMVNMFNDIGD